MVYGAARMAHKKSSPGTGPSGPRRRPSRPIAGVPRVRRGTIRLTDEAALRIRAGHPWVFRDSLGGRPLRESPGDVVDLVDGTGDFVARGVYDVEGAIAVRVVTRDPDEAITPELLAGRVRGALAVRQTFVPADVNAYRLVNGESDGLPGVFVDRYADWLVAQIYTPAVEGWREPIYDALERELGPKGIYEQRRYRPLAGEAPRGPAQLVRGAAAPVEIEVREGPLRFWVDVTAPLSPGLFLDLRDGRQAIARWASGRRVLNLFSYTGAISVFAQHGGAREVVAVDVSAKAHARARRNFALNGFDPEKPEHIVGDVPKILDRLADRGRSFDLVVLDPPAFGTARGQTFSAAQDYRDLVAGALRVLERGGLLVAISSTHKIGHDEFDRMVAEGAARAGAWLRIIERRWLPPDFCVAPGFPEGNYLKFAIAERSRY